MLLMRHGNIPIESSLVSNKMLQYTPDLSTHPFPVYLRFGIPMCLNTDDPGAWDATLTDEFFLAATLYRLRWSEIVNLAENSLRYAFTGKAMTADLLTRFHNDLSTFEEYASNNKLQATPVRSQSGFAKTYLLLENQSVP